MPRKPAADPRDCPIRFRCTERERAQLHRLARASGMNFADFARMRLLTGRTRHRAAKPEFTIPEDPAVRALAHQVHRVGVNLNQIAKEMNIHKKPPPPELRELLAEIRRYVRKAVAL